MIHGQIPSGRERYLYPPCRASPTWKAKSELPGTRACPTAVTARGLQHGQVYSEDICIEDFNLGMTQRTPVTTLMHSRVKQSARALALRPEMALPLLYSAARALRPGVCVKRTVFCPSLPVQQ